MQYSKAYFDTSANKKARFIWLTLCIVLSLAYVIEVLKDLRSISYYFTFLCFLWIPFIAGQFLLKVKGGDTPYYRNVIAIGYSIFYAFALFTSKSPLTFVYVLPLSGMMIIFKDKIFIRRFGIGTLLIIFAFIIQSLINGQNTAINISTYEIEVACIAICFMGYHIAIDHLISADSSMLNSIQSNLDTVVNTVEQVKSASHKIVNGMRLVSTLSDANLEGANEVVSCMTNLADSNASLHDKTYSSQAMTKTINAQVENVAKLITSMVQLVSESTQHADHSKEALEIVVHLTHSMSTLSHQVEEAIHEFSEVFTQVQSDASTIDRITMQTNLLALNASIEAARAGEAGKGFAVVADEIRQLSTITKESSDSIFNSLQSLEHTSSKVIQSVGQITQSINESLVKVNEVNDIVMDISGDTSHLGENISVIDSAIKEVENSNAHMVTNMQDIYHIMEQSTQAVQAAQCAAEEMVAKYQQTLHQVQEVEDILSVLVKDLQA